MSVVFSEEISPEIPDVLPHDKVYQIQVGSKLFKLSGASLSSDAPSHFTDFFGKLENQDKVLFIDRNPEVFDFIYMHLQGYQINIDYDYQFMQLYLDSYYYSLAKLQKFLQEEDLFANVGNESFKISKSLFTLTGNYPNFFTISLNSMLTDRFKLLEKRKMIRPPPQRAITVSNRSPKLFKDLLELLKRNHLVIENEEHRNLLIRECKYYRFLELEQQIIKYKILNNPFAQDGCNKQEIIISLKDLNPKGLVNESPKDGSKEVALEYRRPYLIKEPKRTLIFQIDSGCNDIFNKDYSEVKLIINRTVKVAVLQITNKICLKMVQVFKNICDDFIIKENETGYPQTTILVGLKDSKSIVNGMTMRTNWIGDLLGDVEKEKESEEDEEAPSKKRKIDGDIIEFRLTKSLWRMMIRGNRLRLHCISFEGLTDQSSFIKQEIDFI